MGRDCGVRCTGSTPSGGGACEQRSRHPPARSLLDLGIDVYLIDWGYPDGADRYVTLDDYINGYLHRALGAVLDAHRVSSTTLLGVCQGGTFSLCYAALHPQRVRNLVTMVTPVDFHAGDNLLSRWAQAHRLVAQHEDHVPLALHSAIFLLAVYGAYFGAGLGILTLAILGILLPDDLQHSNALKGLLSALINLVAVVYFVAFGPVRWAPALVMAAGALLGGYLGVGVARRLGKRWLRLAVIAYGLFVAVVLFVR